MMFQRLTIVGNPNRTVSWMANPSFLTEKGLATDEAKF